MTTTYGTLQHLPSKGGRPTWVITAEPHVMIRLKRTMPRILASRTGVVEITDTPEMAFELQWFMQRYRLGMDRAARDRLEQRIGEYLQRRAAVADVLAGNGALPGAMVPARQPRDYQAVAAAVMRASGRMILGDDAGLGKTLTSLLLLDAPDALPALIVAQPHLTEQWLRELGATWPLLVGHILRGTRPYDLANLRAHRGHVPDVLIAGYPRIAGWADHLAGKIRTLIFDECQELRAGTATAKGLAAAQIADQANYVIGASATPVCNYGDEVFNEYGIIAPDALGTKQEFLREWGGAALSNGRSTVADPAALGAYLRDQGLFLRRTRKDVRRELPLPLRIRQEIDSDPAALQALSADVVAMARLILDDTADHRRRFTAAGDLDWRMRQATGIGKAPFVAEFVRMLLESEERVLLFGWHRECYSIWMERLAEFLPVLYTGSESTRQKADAVHAFMEGDSRVLIMSLRSGAGLDGLQEKCSAVVFGELDWSPAVHDQAIWRLNRDGQDATVAAYFLVSPSGADPVMDEVLQLKRSQAEPIRDPDAPVLTPVAADPDHIRKLAASILREQAAA